MNFLMLILFGAFVGWIASMIMGSDDEQGAIANIIIGILGSVLGGYLWTVFTGDNAESLLGQLVLATLGAMAIIGLWRSLTHRRTV